MKVIKCEWKFKGVFGVLRSDNNRISFMSLFMKNIKGPTESDS